jgi:hypothetical protein
MTNGRADRLRLDAYCARNRAGAYLFRVPFVYRPYRNVLQDLLETRFAIEGLRAFDLVMSDESPWQSGDGAA